MSEPWVEQILCVRLVIQFWMLIRNPRKNVKHFPSLRLREIAILNRSTHYLANNKTKKVIKMVGRHHDILKLCTTTTAIVSTIPTSVR